MVLAPKLLILSTPSLTWAVLFLAFRFGGLSLPKLLPWVKFLTFAGLLAWIVLMGLRSSHVDDHMGVLYGL